MKIGSLNVLAILMIFPAHTTGFCGPMISRKMPIFVAKSMSTGSADDSIDDIHTQEMLMEELSWEGQNKIASVSISERAKRALLAEAIEDQIFRLAEELEEIVGRNGLIDDDDKREATALAARAKELKQQYQDLVSGAPSSVLTALESLGDSLT